METQRKHIIVEIVHTRQQMKMILNIIKLLSTVYRQVGFNVPTAICDFHRITVLDSTRKRTVSVEHYLELKLVMCLIGN